MTKFLKPGWILGVIAVVLALAGSATASSLITSSKIKDGTIRTRDIHKGAVTRSRLSADVRDTLRKASAPVSVQSSPPQPGPAGPAGPKGATGATGAKGDKGDKGPTGFEGSFYSVQNYGPISPGAWATVACDPNDPANSQKYVAISGGVEQGAQHGSTTDPDTSTDIQANGGGLSIASEFPGRHAPSDPHNPTAPNDLTVLPNRLDGWIVKFATNGVQAPALAVWALCVPVADDGGKVPVHVNG